MTNETIATETTETVGEFPIDELLSDGITNTPPSFVRAILKAASDPEVTSFAGGLPNPISFPQEKLLESMQRVVAERGPEAFQYSVTAGVPELRAWIAERYNHRFGTDYTEEDVLVTTGSQQVLDLLGKVLLDKGDGVIVEKPTYLAAIQAFALQQPVFREVELTEEGLNIDELNAALDAGAKMIYLIPNFQNPTGLTYTAENREQVREVLAGRNIVVVEDDPYGELRFEGDSLPYIGGTALPHGVIMGSFSKTVTPGFRMGYLLTKDHDLLKALNTAKEAADLHTNVFAQFVVARLPAPQRPGRAPGEDPRTVPHPGPRDDRRHGRVLPRRGELHQARGRHVPLGDAARGRFHHGAVPESARAQRGLRAGRPVLPRAGRALHHAPELHQRRRGDHPRRHPAPGRGHRRRAVNRFEGAIAPCSFSVSSVGGDLGRPFFCHASKTRSEGLTKVSPYGGELGGQTEVNPYGGMRDKGGCGGEREPYWLG